MASPILHIKDSYYFEVPKGLLPRHYASKADFPTLWVQLDPQFQTWEAERLYDEFATLNPSVGPKSELLHEYEQWKHDQTNEGKPFDKFLEQHERYQEWFATSGKLSGGAQWKAAKQRAGGDDAVESFQKDPTITWSSAKIHAYNQHLSGKILIPQPFGELRNFYQSESGFTLSKFMVIEVVIALILWGLFAWLGRQTEDGGRPKGGLWNLLEVFVVYLRDQVARPAIGAHEGDRFVPLLLTLFFFILGCNLFGMLPWMGSPTASFGVTLALAGLTFGSVILFGILKFGPFGFVLNQIPSMDLPLVLAIPLKPFILVIELIGLCIKHSVLSVRLLANMLAGHMVLLVIMGFAFSVEGAASSFWPVIAPASLIGATLLSCLELFVAFLQAYIFTFLSALFIGAAIHHH